MACDAVNSAWSCAQCGVGNLRRGVSPARLRLYTWSSPSSMRRRVVIATPSSTRARVRAQVQEDAGSPAALPSSISPKSSSMPCLTIRRDILPGEIIEFPGVLMVKGDVCSGAAVHASGDIIVFGQLEGEAHAGKNGDSNTIIFGWKLTSKILSIAGHDADALAFSGDLFCKVASLSGCEVRNLKFSPPKSDNDYAAERASITGPNSWFAIDWRSMRKPSKVAAFTGAYIFVVGVALLLFPESLFGLFFDLKSTIRDWIRVGAVLAVVFGIYYIGTAWGDVKGCNGANSFYVSTIVGRVFIFLSFFWLVANGAGGLPLFAVGTTNLIGALTMLNALRKENLEQKST